jgi:benzoate transport
VKNDPREIVAGSRMGWLQIVAVITTIGLNALDGFDVQAISFAGPGIRAEWHLDPAALGVVLSMELIGMALGSIFLGGVADKIGRRRTMLGCLVAMALGMFMATRATSVVNLSIWRVLTGLGIGGMLASVNAVVSEFSNARRKSLNVSIMSIGYPVGAVVGGIIVQHLLAGHDWRSIFYFGAAFTAVFIPLVLILVPESVQWLARKQPAGALERINRTLKRMGHASVSALPSISSEVRRRSMSDIFRPGLVAITVIVTAAYFFHIMTFYFMVKWIPTIVVNMHFPVTSAASVLTWTNVGGAIGGTIFGLLSMRFHLKPLTIATMVLSTALVFLFGRSPANLTDLKLICASADFCMNAAICGMYAIFAQGFPTHVRASGTGFAIGIGRGGAVIAPIIAGFLFQSGLAVPSVATIMACSSLVAACVLGALKLGKGAVEAADELAAPAASASTAS